MSLICALKHEHEKYADIVLGIVSCNEHVCRWFEGFNWDGLRKGTLTPPIIPNVSAYTHARPETYSVQVLYALKGFYCNDHKS